MAAPRNVLVDLLAILFGISSWVEISGIGVEMPLMVDILPEGWRLGSYIVIITQLANIGPLIYGIARRYVSHKVLETPTIHITLAIAVSSCILLSGFWDRTSVIAGEQHSTALLALAFCLALVDCTSSVLYLPFMATFREIYVISCMIGEGACGLFPSILGFIQGIGGNLDCENRTVNNSLSFETTYELVPNVPKPRFSVNVYFIVLSFMVIVSWIAFILLNKWSRIQGEKVTFEHTSTLYSSVTNLTDGRDNEVTSAGNNKDYYVLLTIQTFICFFQNGILSAIQPYSCKPYGNIIYQLSVNLSLISNPVGCFIALFFPVVTVKSVTCVTVFSNIWGIYILYIATQSPYPPMQENVFGGVLMVISWIIFVGAMSYIKAVIAAILRRDGGNKALFWGGAMSQIGSAIGAVVMFAIVNYTTVFKSGSSC